MSNGKCALCHKENVEGIHDKIYLIDGPETMFFCDDGGNNENFDFELTSLIASQGKVVVP
jgi:hypothetical protein